MTLPNFLVIGAPKAGTTSLHLHLRAHPAVFMPELKEPRFFGYEGEGERLKFPIRTLEEYDRALRRGDRARPRSARRRRTIWSIPARRSASTT